MDKLSWKQRVKFSLCNYLHLCTQSKVDKLKFSGPRHYGFDCNRSCRIGKIGGLELQFLALFHPMVAATWPGVMACNCIVIIH